MMRKSRAANVVTSSRPDDTDEDLDQSVNYSDDEDFVPEKKKGGKGGKVSAAPKRKSAGGAPKGRGKRAKKVESEPECDDDEEDDNDDLDESDEDGDGKGKKAKKSQSVGKNQPDKDGYMELNLFKNDLTKNFRSDEKLCMWRRDGASLLQKYMVVTDESANKDIVFKASSVYSCWEEKRKNDFFQIKVKVIGDKKEGKVKVVDIGEFEQLAKEDRPKIDITPRGAEGGENYEEDSEEENDENDEDDE